MKKPFKIAGWCGLISFVLSIIVMPILFFSSEGVFKSVFSLIFSIGTGILGLFFLYGFVALGKKFRNNLLLVMTWIGIVIAIISLLFTLFSWGIDLTGLVNDASNAMLFLFIWIAATVVFGVYSILLGVGLMRLDKDVPYARASGILSIIAGASYIIFIGIFIQIAVTVLEIIVLFKASGKFE